MKAASRIKRFVRALFEKEPDSTKSPEVWTNKKAVYSKYSIGDWTYGEPIVMDWGSQLTIGKYCSIAEDVTFLLGGNHRADWVTTYPFSLQWQGFSGIQGHPATKGDTVVGNDVWIGTRSLILSGVQIGDGGIIGAGSVVTKNVPSYSIVAGNPAKFIRFRFPEDIIEKLVMSAWWDLSEDKIKQLIPFLMTSRVDLFLEKIAQLNSKISPGGE